MSGTKLGDAGAGELAGALKVNTTLKSLDLSGTKLGDAGAGELAGALKVNTTLETLELGDTKLGDAGVGELGQALRTRPCPRSGSFTLRGVELGRAAALLGLPPDAQQWTNDAILRFFWEAQRSGATKCLRVKLVLVGPGGGLDCFNLPMLIRTHARTPTHTRSHTHTHTYVTRQRGI